MTATEVDTRTFEQAQAEAVQQALDWIGAHRWATAGAWVVAANVTVGRSPEVTIRTHSVEQRDRLTECFGLKSGGAFDCRQGRTDSGVWLEVLS